MGPSPFKKRKKKKAISPYPCFKAISTSPFKKKKKKPKTHIHVLRLYEPNLIFEGYNPSPFLKAMSKIYYLKAINPSRLKKEEKKGH